MASAFAALAPQKAATDQVWSKVSNFSKIRRHLWPERVMLTWCLYHALQGRFSVRQASRFWKYVRLRVRFMRQLTPAEKGFTSFHNVDTVRYVEEVPDSIKAAACSHLT